MFFNPRYYVDMWQTLLQHYKQVLYSSYKFRGATGNKWLQLTMESWKKKKKLYKHFENTKHFFKNLKK